MKVPAEVIMGPVTIAVQRDGAVVAQTVLGYMLGDLAVTPANAEASCRDGVLWTITHVPTGIGLGAGAALFRQGEDAVGAMYDIHTLFGRPHEISIEAFAPRQMDIVRICKRRRGCLPGESAYREAS